MKKLLMHIIIVILNLNTFGQYINPSGEWRSTSGNEFTVIVVNNGIKYTNKNTGDIINAGLVGLNKYKADFYIGNILAETCIITVLDNNTIEVRKPAINQAQYWNRVLPTHQIFECGIISNSFNFVYAEQKNTKWCWAACIQMILNYYGVEITQSQVVYRTFGANTGGNLPNWAGDIYSIHANLNNWNIDNSGKKYVVSAACYRGAPNKDWLIEELSNGYPVFIGYNTGSGGHAVLITACTYLFKNGQSEIQTLTVRDPWPGNNIMIYNGYDLASKIQAHWYIRVTK
jgi:hypothetical protein